jgi:hypothetical protein
MSLLLSQMNQILLSMHSDRIPIVAPISRSGHIDSGQVLLWLSDFIDLDKLSDAVRIPIIEWKDLKRRNSTDVEELGCWSP